MPRVFEIHEEDLATLESTLPQIADRLTPDLDNRLRVQIRRVQSILSNVRWNYGPAKRVKIVRPEDLGDQTL